MNEASFQALAHLLGQAGAAHGHYETTVLGGVYDHDWPDWYARWAVAHGFNDLVARPVDAAALSRLLAELNEAHLQAGKPRPWAAFTAERLLTLLG